MIGQTAPTSDVARFAEQITTMSRRLRELELAKRPHIQSGVVTGTSDGSGDLTVTFPAPFAAAPVVLLTRRSTLTSARTVTLVSKSSTGFVARIFGADGAVQASVSYIVEWQAIVT